MNAPSQAIVPSTTSAVVVSAVAITEFLAETKKIVRQATDIMANPLISDGYALSGMPSSLAFVHLTMMANKRLKYHFPCFDQTDPVFGRLLAEAKLIVAKCMLVKYECRARRQAYNHLEDMTVQINKLVRDRFDMYKEQIKKLSVDGTV